VPFHAIVRRVIWPGALPSILAGFSHHRFRRAAAGGERGNDWRPVRHRRLCLAGRQPHADRSAAGGRGAAVAVRARQVGEADQLAGSAAAALAVRLTGRERRVGKRPRPRRAHHSSCLSWRARGSLVIGRARSREPVGFAHPTILSIVIARSERRSNPCFLCGAMDCFASLAMTTMHCPYLPGTNPAFAAPGGPKKLNSTESASGPRASPTASSAPRNRSRGGPIQKSVRRPGCGPLPSIAANTVASVARV